MKKCTFEVIFIGFTRKSDHFWTKKIEVRQKIIKNKISQMCPLSVWECPRRTCGTLGCPCASLACPWVRARLPLLGWSGLRLSLAAQGGDITKIWEKPEKSWKSWFFVFSPNVLQGVRGCSQHASGTPACLCAFRFAHTRLDSLPSLIIIWSFQNTVQRSVASSLSCWVKPKGNYKPPGEACKVFHIIL